MDGKGDSQMDRDKQRQIGGGGGRHTYKQTNIRTDGRIDKTDLGMRRDKHDGYRETRYKGEQNYLRKRVLHINFIH